MKSAGQKYIIMKRAFSIALVVLFAVYNTGQAFKCYSCQNYDSSWEWWYYDEGCGINQAYEGNIVDCESCDSCGTRVWHDGRMGRTEATGAVDGQCDYGNTWTDCYCKTELCNAGRWW
ncbi:unnamed protein product [Meganyctiphanes norvegica]|uniref:Uncharacterized protein n=1 Tax=Meganyctiphanes norvegica TaxID=48144 RepID=A0AAV2Q3K3_MEGNR